MPLQKSYSERAETPKNRQPWQRSHSHPRNVATPKPHRYDPISDVTKEKLSKFHYQSQRDQSTSEDASVAEARSTSSLRADQGTKSVSTPSNGLNWQYLVDSGAPVDDDKDTSPSDKIMWDNKQDALYIAALSPMLARRRKRARSSSPISSPLADQSEQPKLNVGRLKEALKSEHADPTLELWDRYLLNTSTRVASHGGAVKPVLEQLLISSSPKPSEDCHARQAGGNLRRALSCGLNWPKRRNSSKMGGCQSSSKQRQLEAASKTSLVTALLKTVTSNLQDESSLTGPVENIEASSPKRRRLCPSSPDFSCVKAAGGSGPASDPPSDYGDDDFDDDSFMELEASIKAAAASQRVTEAGIFHSSEIGNVESPAADKFQYVDDEIFVESDKPFKNTRCSPLKDPPPLSALEVEREGLAGQAGPEDEFEDDFDGDIDFDAVELAATQSVQRKLGSPATAAPGLKARTIQRYLVTSVLEGDYVDQGGQTQAEKVGAFPSKASCSADIDQILIIQADGSKMLRTVHLRGSWFDTPAHAEAYVHVIGNFSARGQCIVDDGQNLLILHPDQLISATVVADSFSCMRRAVLQDRVKATSEPSPPLVYGTMLHEIFQEALLANQWDLPFLHQVINRTAEQHVEDLYTIKVSLAMATEYLWSKMAQLCHWAGAFVSAKPKADALVEDRHGKSISMAITKLLDVEEHVWSPMYGLKGNIDATVEAVMIDGRRTRTVTVPFEVKTGKNTNSSHLAQTALYTLLLSDRYDIEVAYGILYYMETSKTMRIPAVRHELRHMIMQRNQLACYVRERSVQLPPMLKSKYMCGRCYAKTSCFTYHRLADGGFGKSSGLGDKFDELVKHLTAKHRDFFVRWENLLTKEEKEGQKTKRELWTMTSKEREKKSRCFSDVIIEEGSASVSHGDSRISRYLYTFVKREQRPDFSFLGSELSVGEPIVVSDEEGHFALAIGYVTLVRKQRISVAVDRQLHNARTRQPGFDEVEKQVFASIMEVAGKGRPATDEVEGGIRAAPVRYRLDKDEFSNGMATVRNNLIQMMANDVPGASQIRRLVVDLAAPRFKAAPTQYTIADGESLNVDQRRAIEKVMGAQDYALVLGMPGTGKTTTIAHMIRALVSQGKSVLLTSHTHTAVDNILLKLKSDKWPMLRLGVPAKVHPEVQKFVHLAGQPGKTFEEIKEAWHGTPVVATTCLGINHAVFLERTFDYCIVDEASQITLPICVGPIRLASAFVLVGDHNQLPPVVRNEEAREGGLDVSLFKLLSDAHPESVVNLEHQYRMCEDIMTLSNTLIYGGKLRCGTEALRRLKLQVPSMGALRRFHFDAASLMRPGTPCSFCAGPAPSCCWLRDALDGEARVRFINTDTVQPLVREEAQGKRIVNSAEVRIVAQLVESLIAAGVPADEVGVMTHYRAQLFLLRDRLRGQTAVEMHTTDRFQGRDKEVVVLSMVRSNEACNIGDLLRDWRRINVAFTRAKTKLLVVGSRDTLKHAGGGDDSMLGRFVALMEQRDWVYHLPPDALVSHDFEEPTATAASPVKTSLPPRKRTGAAAAAPGKENRRPSPRRAGIGAKALLKGRLITRNILNDMTDGAYGTV